MSALGGHRLPSPVTVLAAGAVAVWSVGFVGGFTNVALPVPIEIVVPFATALPVLFVAAWLLGAGRFVPYLGELVGCMALVALALIAGIAVPLAPILLLIVPGVVVAVLLARRHRVAALLGAFVLSSAFGSITAFTPLRPGPMVDVLLLGLLLALVWRRPGEPARTRTVVWPSVVLVVLFLSAALVAVLLAPSLEFGLHAFRAAAWYLLAFVVVAHVPWTRVELERLTRGVVTIAALVAAYAVYRWQAGPAVQEYELAISSASVYNFVEGRLRTLGSFTSGHELGAWAAAIVPFCTAYALTHRNRWGAISALAAALGVVALLASEARIGVVGVAAGLTVVLVLYQVARGFEGLRLGTTATLVGAAAIVAIVAFSAVVGGESTRAERFANILTPERDPAYQVRVVKWQTAMAALERRPLGYGIGTAGRVQQRSGRFVTEASVNVDNAYLKLAWEYGYGGLALYVALLVALLIALVRRAATVPDGFRAGPAIGAAGTLASYSILLFAALYDEGLVALVVWLLVGIGAAHVMRRPPSAQATRSGGPV